MKRNEFLTNIVYGIHGIYAKASEPEAEEEGKKIKKKKKKKREKKEKKKIIVGMGGGGGGGVVNFHSCHSYASLSI